MSEIIARTGGADLVKHADGSCEVIPTGMNGAGRPKVRLGMPARCPECRGEYLAEFEGGWLAYWLAKLDDERRDEIIAQAAEIRSNGGAA